jgi:hypothetical protein
MYANGSTSSCGSTSAVYSGVNGWLLGGSCDSSGSLGYQGSNGTYWSSSENSSTRGDSADVGSSNFYPQRNYYKYYGFALRCVR